jgi:hypothetical protein
MRTRVVPITCCAPACAHRRRRTCTAHACIACGARARSSPVVHAHACCAHHRRRMRTRAFTFGGGRSRIPCQACQPSVQPKPSRTRSLLPSPRRLESVRNNVEYFLVQICHIEPTILIPKVNVIIMSTPTRCLLTYCRAFRWKIGPPAASRDSAGLGET